MHDQKNTLCCLKSPVAKKKCRGQFLLSSSVKYEIILNFNNYGTFWDSLNSSGKRLGLKITGDDADFHIGFVRGGDLHLGRQKAGMKCE